MHNDKMVAQNIKTSQEPTNQAEPASEVVVQSTPKPVMMRAVMLFGAAVGCLLVGIVVSRTTGDMLLLAMSAILCVAFITKGILLKRKIKTGQIYSVSGVCVSITPKILGRYRRIDLVNTDTGDDVSFILPKKVTFKIGHVYSCYFDNQVGNQPLSINNPKGRFIKSDMDLPTNGFLGFEDFGVYQERSVSVVASVTASVTDELTTASTSEQSMPYPEDDVTTENCKEDQE